MSEKTYVTEISSPVFRPSAELQALHSLPLEHETGDEYEIDEGYEWDDAESSAYVDRVERGLEAE
jgi:hypothetical protein